MRLGSSIYIHTRIGAALKTTRSRPALKTTDDDDEKKKIYIYIYVPVRVIDGPCNCGHTHKYKCRRTGLTYSSLRLWCCGSSLFCPTNKEIKVWSLNKFVFFLLYQIWNYGVKILEIWLKLKFMMFLFDLYRKLISTQKFICVTCFHLDRTHTSLNTYNTILLDLTY